MKRINRRRFNQALGATLVTAPLFTNQLIQAQTPITLEKSVIAVAEGKIPAAIVKAALDALGGIKTWVKPGHKVVVKPNIGWDKLPQMAANTNPQLVAEIVRLCKEAGASQVLVFDRSCNDPRRTYINSGIKEAVEQAGGKTLYVRSSDQPGDFQTINIPNGTLLKQWDFFSEAIRADVYINVPIAKHHSLTQLTLGIKNIMGIIGGNRGSLHVDIGEKLADLHRVFRPTLTIMDAYRVLLRNGPTGGNPQDTQLKFTCIAGVDPVAVDAYTATLFNLKPGDVSYIPACAKTGLGTDQLDRIEVKKVQV